GTDQTAAAALDIIDDVLREQVGLDRANSTRPLRRAKEALEAAERAENEARHRHDNWQRDLERITELTAQAATARQHLARAEAIAAREAASEARERFEEIEALRVDVGDTTEAGSIGDLAAVERDIDMVGDALQSWRDR